MTQASTFLYFSTVSYSSVPTSTPSQSQPNEHEINFDQLPIDNYCMTTLLNGARMLTKEIPSFRSHGHLTMTNSISSVKHTRRSCNQFKTLLVFLEKPTNGWMTVDKRSSMPSLTLSEPLLHPASHVSPAINVQQRE